MQIPPAAPRHREGKSLPVGREAVTPASLHRRSQPDDSTAGRIEGVQLVDAVKVGGKTKPAVVGKKPLHIHITAVQHAGPAGCVMAVDPESVVGDGTRVQLSVNPVALHQLHPVRRRKTVHRLETQCIQQHYGGTARYRIFGNRHQRTILGRRRIVPPCTGAYAFLASVDSDEPYLRVRLQVPARIGPDFAPVDTPEGVGALERRYAVGKRHKVSLPARSVDPHQLRSHCHAAPDAVEQAVHIAVRGILGVMSPVGSKCP